MAKLLLLCLWNVFLHEQMIKGVLGQCTGGVPINIAVYEGDTNVAMMCNSPTKVSWSLRPTSDQLGSYKITNYDDVVAPTYANLFGVNSTGLNVKTAQGLATIPPISTAGLYTILINGSTTKYGAKLTIVRQPPSCNCTANSTKIQLNCSLTYADSSYNPISATMTWSTGDGIYLKNDTPAGGSRTLKNGLWTSVSTIYVDVYNPTNYQCTVTFSQPTSVSYPYVATNAPAFSETCTPPYCGYTTTQIPTTTTMTTITIRTTSTPPLTTTTPSLTTSTHPATTTTPTATTTTPTTTTTPPTTPTTPPTTTTTPPTTTTTPPTTPTTLPTTTTTPPTTTTTTTTTPTTTPSPTTSPPTTTTTPTILQPTANPSTALSSNTECNCPQTTSCSSQDDSCTKDSECQPDGTALINIHDECVVKAELYARCDNCCPDNLICGVVVTLRDDSRWLIYDSICNDNKCEVAVVSASCMSSNWKLMAEKKIVISGVGDYVEAGNGVQVGLNATDCSESCKRMMNLL